MRKQVFVFDKPHIIRLNQGRWKALNSIIKNTNLSFRTALDAGTGIGYFAEYLSSEYKLQITAFDARPSNIEEAQKRYPDVRFVVGNIEDPDIVKLGKFDIVIAFGLIYHLENPFRAIKNLVEMTEKLLVVESVIFPGKTPSARIVEEPKSEDQSVGYVALRLTEKGIIKILYLSGIPYVYFPFVKVDHEEFNSGMFRNKKRIILVASHYPLDNDLFSLISEPSCKYGEKEPYYRTSMLRWLIRRYKSLRT